MSRAKRNEAAAIRVMNEMATEIQRLRDIQETHRNILFGAFLGRALGDEEKLSDAFLKAHRQLFAGFEEKPWMALSEVS